MTAEGNYDMSLLHAVVWSDHQSAEVLQFDDEQVLVNKVKAPTHHTAQHGSAVRSEHEFFGALCDALGGIGQVPVTGSRTARVDFRHYADKQRPQTAAHNAVYEVVDHRSENQLVALARKYFLAHPTMVRTQKSAWFP